MSPSEDERQELMLKKRERTARPHEQATALAIIVHSNITTANDRGQYMRTRDEEEA